MNRLMLIVDFFIPQEHLNSYQLHMRSRLTVIILLLVVGSLPVMMYQQLIHQDFTLFTVASLSMLTFLSALVLHYQRPNLRRSALFLLIGGCVGITITSALSGGLYSPVTPLFAVLPILAFAILGMNSSIFWFFGCTGLLIAFSVIAKFGYFVSSLDKFIQPIPFLSNFILLMFIALGLIWFNEKLRQEQHSKLEEALRRVDAASSAKSAFMANMSHELRTPMNGVLGMTELILKNSSLPERTRQDLLAVEESGKALVELLNDILDLSKIEAGKMSIEELPWEPGRTLKNIQRLFEGSAIAKGLQLSLHLDPAMPERILGDPMKVRQVMTNLVGNAVKFTSTGSVQIEGYVEESQLKLSVQDTGPGINEAKQALIFEPFTQEDTSTSRKHGGSGLGLTISMHLMKLMGGTLQLTSSDTTGSRFEVSLPVKIAENNAQPLESQIKIEQELDLNNKSVLLVEDVPINQMVAKGMLEVLGCRVDIADDGLVAWDMLQQGKVWDVILMDWHLPGLDGVELTKRLRRQGYKGAIVAVSASVRDEDRKIMETSGMDGFLGKPFTQAELGKAIKHALHLYQEQNTDPECSHEEPTATSSSQANEACP